MAWVDEACGFVAKEQAGTLKQTDVYLFRVAQKWVLREPGEQAREHSDFFVVDLVGESVLVVRDDLALRAFGNVAPMAAGPGSAGKQVPACR